jgi:hypothetical protein
MLGAFLSFLQIIGLFKSFEKTIKNVSIGDRKEEKTRDKIKDNGRQINCAGACTVKTFYERKHFFIVVSCCQCLSLPS